MAYEKVSKKAFLIYYDDFETVSKTFDNERLGKWLRYIADYEINGVEPEIKDDDLLAFVVGKNIQTLARDRVKYNESVKKKTETAYKRELKRWHVVGFTDKGIVNCDTTEHAKDFSIYFGSRSVYDIDKDWLTWAFENNWNQQE